MPNHFDAAFKFRLNGHIHATIEKGCDVGLLRRAGDDGQPLVEVAGILHGKMNQNLDRVCD